MHDDTAPRLTKVEERVVVLQHIMERNESQFAVILTKLDQLPRLTAVLETYGSALDQVVPRSEVEARLKAIEERIKIMDDRR